MRDHGSVRPIVPALALLLGALLPAACADDADRAAPTPAGSTTATAVPTASAGPTADPARLAALGVNELGAIPVFMYHQFVEKPRRIYDMSPDAFREQLQTLYDAGYRPITAAALAAGEIDLPAGRHPVVLTFDDSTWDQARLRPDGTIDPKSAAGILEEFEREHPDFPAVATFFVNSTPEPFTDRRVLTWLAENGHEIAAHTWSHADLGRLDDAGVQAEIGQDIAWLEEAVPGLTVRTLAVPFGVHPRNRELLRAGSHDGVPYRLEAVFGVSEIASPSPFSLRFDLFDIPRLDTGLGVRDAQDALERLAADPTLRYTSDGDPDRITFPADRADRLNPDLADRAHAY